MTSSTVRVCAHVCERETEKNPTLSFLTSPWDRKMASQNTQGTKGRESFKDFQNTMTNQTR